MFYWNEDKKAIREAFDYLENELNKVAIRVADLEAELILAKEFPHGAKKDGTPRKKPGRKPAKSFTVNVK